MALMLNKLKSNWMNNSVRVRCAQRVFIIGIILSNWALKALKMTNDQEDHPMNKLSILISQILDEEPYASIRYIAGRVGSNLATVYRHVTIYLGRIYMHSKYVPHDLNAL